MKEIIDSKNIYFFSNDSIYYFYLAIFLINFY